MRTLGLIRAAAPEPPSEVWPRLRARLADDERVRLQLPAIGWRDAMALTVTLGTLAVVPDPVHFLTVCGLL
jgi:hypothetical protein